MQVRTLVESNKCLKNVYLSLCSHALSIIRIRCGLVGSVRIMQLNEISGYNTSGLVSLRGSRVMHMQKNTNTGPIVAMLCAKPKVLYGTMGTKLLLYQPLCRYSPMAASCFLKS